MPDTTRLLIDDIIEDLRRTDAEACREDGDYERCRKKAADLADESGATLRQAWEEVVASLPPHEQPRIQILDMARAGLAKALMHRWKPVFVLLAGVDFVNQAREERNRAGFNLPPVNPDDWRCFCSLLRRLVTANRPSPIWNELSDLWRAHFEEVEHSDPLWAAAHDLYCAAACLAGQEEDRRWLADCLSERWHFQKVCTESQDRWTSLFVAAAVLRGADSVYDGIKISVAQFIRHLETWGV